MRARLFGMITTKDSSEYTVEALRTFFMYTNFRDIDQFILIDNDGAWDDKKYTHPAVKLIRNNSPLGFASNSNNLAREAINSNSDLYVLNNDLIFTAAWNDPLDQSGISISCPLSNREVQYVMALQVAKTGSSARVFTTPLEMNLDQYHGFEYALQAVAEAHKANSAAGVLPILVLPYFCVRISLEILKSVGLFDEDFGRGGGEDYDYSLRAHLLGFPVHYALKSWLVHFYGKSSWSGVEVQAQRLEREKKMIAHFEQKWGTILREIIFSEKENLIIEQGLAIPTNSSEFANVISILRERGLKMMAPQS